jgi:serine/threonine protein kinase
MEFCESSLEKLCENSNLGGLDYSSTRHLTY